MKKIRLKLKILTTIVNVEFFKLHELVLDQIVNNNLTKKGDAFIRIEAAILALLDGFLGDQGFLVQVLVV